eukprot:2921758-Amphidinium_carterae.1
MSVAEHKPSGSKLVVTYSNFHTYTILAGSLVFSTAWLRIGCDLKGGAFWSPSCYMIKTYTQVVRLYSLPKSLTYPKLVSPTRWNIVAAPIALVQRALRSACSRGRVLGKHEATLMPVAMQHRVTRRSLVPIFTLTQHKHGSKYEVAKY